MARQSQTAHTTRSTGAAKNNLTSPETVPAGSMSAGPLSTDQAPIVSLAKRPSRLANLLQGLFVSFITIVLLAIGIEIKVRYQEYRQKAPAFAPATLAPERPQFYYKAEGTPSFSDYPHHKAKPANTFRIGVVGDSFSFTPYMQFDDVFPKRLERMLHLHEHHEGSLTAEVINYGKFGLSSPQEIPMVQRAVQAKSDLVILQITLNDAQLQPYHVLKKDPTFKYSFGDLEISPQHNAILYYWHSLGLLVQRIHASRTHSSYVAYYNDIYNEPETWNRFSNAILHMKLTCDASGTKFAAVLFPFFDKPFDKNYPYAGAHAKITGLLKQLGIEYLDLRSAYEGIPNDRMQVSPGFDAHPNEIAHRIAAEHIYMWLEHTGLIPDALHISEKFVTRNSHKNGKITKF